LFLLGAIPAIASPPTSITIQGRLTGPGGAPLIGERDFRVRFFTAQTAGVQLGADVTGTTQLSDVGRFNLELVPSAAVIAASQVWYEVAIDSDTPTNGIGPGDVFADRVQILSVPFSLLASNSELLGGVGAAGYVLDAELAAGLAGKANTGHTHSLDQSYDNGGAGLGRTITADAGPVTIAGNDGLSVIKRMVMTDNRPAATVDLQSWAATTGGGILTLTNGSSPTVFLRGDRSGGLFSSSAAGGVILSNTDGVQTFFAGGDNASLFNNSDRGAYLGLSDGTRTTVLLDSDHYGDGGAYLQLQNSNGRTTYFLDADVNNDPEFMLFEDDGTSAVRFTVTDGGQLHLFNNAGQRTILIDSDWVQDSEIWLYDGSGNTAIALRSDNTGSAGEISLYDADGDETVEIVAAESSTEGGQIRLRKADGTATIEIDADFGGDGRIITQELQITGGSDLSEQFDISAAKGKVEPGMVVCIDPNQAGNLMLSTQAYDRRVAGIVSGAGGIETGMMMGQTGTKADGKHAVALTGRVYCWCDAGLGAIAPGDLLTTSKTPGHAMKVKDQAKAQGAILGKAMTALPKGKGLVLVLVSLQ
jgi:hypothetical protein